MKKIKHGVFDSQKWYKRLIGMAKNADSQKRYQELVTLHQETIDFYISQLKRLNEKTASKISSDKRPVKIVVAHILGWEEWQVQVFSNKNPKESIKQQMKLKGYYDPKTNKTYDFGNVDDFNAYQARKYKHWTWKRIQKKAIDTALKLQSFFPSHPRESWIKVLDHTPSYHWKLTSKLSIDLPQGWYLWMISLEHEAVEHRKDLLW